jgi:hypothetical protein
MLQWRDGLVRTRGETLRQIPERHTWSSQLMISKAGDIHRRTYNPVTREWTWSRQPLVYDDDGRQGLHLPHFVPLPQLICMAWRPREPGTATSVLVRSDRPPIARYLKWAEEEKAVDAEADLAGETLRPLEGVKIGIVPIGKGYAISSHARLMGPKGDITAGFWWDGRRWAATSAGLLDLTSAAKGRRETVVPPSVREAMDALACGVPAAEYATHRGVEEQSGWTYYGKAAQHLSPKDLRRACLAIVPSRLWRALLKMKKEEDPRLGAKLTDLMQTLDTEYIHGFAQSRLRFEKLRLARMAMVA